VAYVREGSVVYLTTGDRWSADVERGSRVAIRLAGRWFPDVAATRSDPEDASRTLFRLFSERPWFRVLSGIPATSSGAPSRRALDRAIAAGRALVLISLDPEPVPRAGAESGL
jgi:hypothetical protein